MLGVERPSPAQGGGGDYRFERHVTHHEPDGTRRRGASTSTGVGASCLRQSGEPAPRSQLFGRRPRQSGGRRPQFRRLDAADAEKPRARRKAMPATCRATKAAAFRLRLRCRASFRPVCRFLRHREALRTIPRPRRFSHLPRRTRRPEIRERLRAVWNDPRSIPHASRTSDAGDCGSSPGSPARWKRGIRRKQVATFLMRCVFCMFAQSVGLLPSPTAFTDVLRRLPGGAGEVRPLVEEFWRAMNEGGFSFQPRRRCCASTADCSPPARTAPSRCRDERRSGGSSSPRAATGPTWSRRFSAHCWKTRCAQQRGELGAHFTPRAFVERLVLPTVMEPCARSGTASRRPPTGGSKRATGRARRLFAGVPRAAMRCPCA